jgi:hypothetical protein
VVPQAFGFHQPRLRRLRASWRNRPIFSSVHSDPARHHRKPVGPLQRLTLIPRSTASRRRPLPRPFRITDMPSGWIGADHSVRLAAGRAKRSQVTSPTRALRSQVQPAGSPRTQGAAGCRRARTRPGHSCRPRSSRIRVFGNTPRGMTSALRILRSSSVAEKRRAQTGCTYARSTCLCRRRDPGGEAPLDRARQAAFLARFAGAAFAGAAFAAARC